MINNGTVFVSASNVIKCERNGLLVQEMRNRLTRRLQLL